MVQINKAVRTVIQLVESKLQSSSAQSIFPVPSQTGRVLLGSPVRRGVPQAFIANQR
jgi:hypothetical protein